MVAIIFRNHLTADYGIFLADIIIKLLKMAICRLEIVGERQSFSAIRAANAGLQPFFWTGSPVLIC